MVTATDRAYAAIRDGITSGKFGAGDRLREEDLAAQIGVSRTPVREALRRLASESLIEFNPHRGAQVASWDDAELDEIFSLRALLEGFGAALAATRLTSAELGELRSMAKQMRVLAVGRSDGYLEEIAQLNNLFHGNVLAGAKSPRLSSMLAGVVQMPLVQRTFHRYSPEHLDRSIAHHIELVTALELGDSEWAASVMRSHILAARHVLR